MTIANHVFVFLISFVAGLGCTWSVRFFALRLGIVNSPNPIVPQHVKPIAYLGGLGIYFGVVLSVGYLIFYKSFSFENAGDENIISLGALAASASAFLLLGAIDDLVELRPSFKFIGQSLISISVVSAGLKISLCDIYLVDTLLSMFILIAVVNAVNLTDVCDGLVGGICAISFFVLGILAPSYALLSFSVSGACFGFLVFNSPQASIFLGDAGSHLLGFVFYVYLILVTQNESFTGAIVDIALLPGVFIFELIFISVMRIRRGLPWWKGSPDHFSLRLQSIGMKRSHINYWAWSTNAFLIVLACSFSQLEYLQQSLLVGGVLLIFSIYWHYLSKIPVVS